MNSGVDLRRCPAVLGRGSGCVGESAEGNGFIIGFIIGSALKGVA